MNLNQKCIEQSDTKLYKNRYVYSSELLSANCRFWDNWCACKSWKESHLLKPVFYLQKMTNFVKTRTFYGSSDQYPQKCHGSLEDRAESLGWRASAKIGSKQLRDSVNDIVGKQFIPSPGDFLVLTNPHLFVHSFPGGLGGQKENYR